MKKIKETFFKFCLSPCGECSTNEDWQNFCSKECEDANKEETEKETKDEKPKHRSKKS